MKKVLFFLTLLLTAVQAVRADDIPFRQQRRELFRVMPVNENSIVFLGNSITNFGTWAEMFGSDPHVVNRGISGNLSGEVLEHLDLIVSGHPRKIFLMIGINDYTNPACVVPNTERIIDVVERESPQTELYIQSLLPCNRADRKGMVEPINKELEKLCQRRGVTYIDVYSRIVGTGNPPGIAPAYTNDNLHVVASGYRAWTRGYEAYTGIAPVWPEGGNTYLGNLNAFENLMLSQYALLPANDGDVLMIGDYNVQTGEWMELLGDKRVKNRGIGIGWGYSLTLDKLRSIIPHIVKGKPGKIFLQCGMRDVAGNATVASAWAAYQETVAAIRRAAPEAEVYLQSLIPSTEARTNTDKIEPFNAKIKAYAEGADAKTHFIDVYAALSENGVLATRFRGANTAQSRGINGRGYLRWANTLAPHIEGCHPIPELTDGAFALNEALSAARRTAFNAIVGEQPGNATEAGVQTLRTAIDAAATVLAAVQAGTASDEEANAQVELLEKAQAEMAQTTVLPKTSTEAETHWYKLSTPMRSGTFVQNQGAEKGVVSKPETNYTAQQWKFVERTDGAWDIVSRADGSHLSPASAGNTQIFTRTEQPSDGWTLRSIPATDRFIIVSNSVQLNQTNFTDNMIYNWGGGENMTDDGCQFRVTEVTVEPDPDPVPAPPAELPAPLLTLAPVTLDGTAPYRVPDALAKPVLEAESVSVAIDFTLSHNRSEMALVGSSNSAEAEEYVCISVATANNAGVRYNNTTGKYTSAANIGTARHHLVITMQPENPSCAYYLDGQHLRDVAAVVPTLGNVSGVDGLYLGGIVCADNANKYPMTGTIHSVQFFPGTLTAEQVAAIDYSNPVPTGLNAVQDNGDAPFRIENGRPIVRDGAEAMLHDLSGKRVPLSRRATAGVYLLSTGGNTYKVVLK